MVFDLKSDYKATINISTKSMTSISSFALLFNWRNTKYRTMVTFWGWVATCKIPTKKIWGMQENEM